MLLVSFIFPGNIFHSLTPTTDRHIAFMFVREYVTINVFILRVWWTFKLLLNQFCNNVGSVYIYLIASIHVTRVDIASKLFIYATPTIQHKYLCAYFMIHGTRMLTPQNQSCPPR